MTKKEKEFLKTSHKYALGYVKDNFQYIYKSYRTEEELIDAVTHDKYFNSIEKDSITVFTVED